METTLPCPSCGNFMDEQSYLGGYGQEVVIDLCHSCNAIWFDDKENLALSPGSILSLFEVMHHERAAQPTALSDDLSCPRCSERLRREVNMVKNVRYTHFRCQQRHGQLITFYEFLREKHFIKPLFGKKLKELRQHVQTVNCSNCGAPIDLNRTTTCGHCHSPLALLDPDALQNTVKELQEREDKNKDVNGEQLAADLMLERLKTERVFSELDRTFPSHSIPLVDLCLRLLFGR